MLCWMLGHRRPEHTPPLYDENIMSKEKKSNKESKKKALMTPKEKKAAKKMKKATTGLFANDHSV
jgi:hypothetical protein